jgi:hypothetical protein
MSETTALAKSTYLPPPDKNEWDSMIAMANTLAKAQGFLPAHFFGQPYKILAAVLFGRDLGISATNALQHIIVIEGKATADAQLIGMLVRRAGHSIEDRTTDQESTVTITRGDDKTKHEVTFSMQDAQRAGLTRAGSAWQKYPQAMLYARALTACARKSAQDALMGTVYTPEELGAQVDAEGSVVLPPDGQPTGEIPILEASQATQEALATAEAEDMGEIAPQEIRGNSQPPETVLSGSLTTPTATGSVGPQNGKRRGRPPGSKNQPKPVEAPSERSKLADGSLLTDSRPAALSAKTSAPPPAFGDEPDPLEQLRKEIRQLASRLRRYQYMEQSRELPASSLWDAEVKRTLGTYVERKFGTEVVLEDVEEAGLRDALSELQSYIEKYESPDDVTVDDLLQRGAGGTAKALGDTAPDTTVVTLHKPIVRNPIPAQRRDPTQIDPKAGLDRARALGELRNRTTALLATREGLVQLTAKDEDRLREQADATMERVAQNSFQKAIKDLDVEQLALLNERAKAAAK